MCVTGFCICAEKVDEGDSIVSGSGDYWARVDSGYVAWACVRVVSCSGVDV